MKTFPWLGMPSDIQVVLESLLSVPGIRFVSSDAMDGFPVFFTAAGPDLWRDIERHDHLLVAGPFTVDLRLSPAKVFVLERSVPDVNCSYPLATTRFPHRVDRLIHSLRVEAAPPC